MKYDEFIDRLHWPKLDPENCREFLQYLGNSPLVESCITDQLVWIKTGIFDNSKNGVLRTRVAQSDADSLIEEILSRFRGLAYQWIVTRDCQPDNLGQKLLAQGFIDISGGVSMTMDLKHLNEDIPLKPGLSAERVHDNVQLNAWQQVYDSPDEPDQKEQAIYASLGLSGDLPLRHYIATLEGRPASVCSLFLGRRTAGIHNVVTLSAARRQGAATNLVLAALRDARDAGYRMATVGPSPEARNLYERLGFVLHPCKEESYSAPGD